MIALEAAEPANSRANFMHSRCFTMQCWASQLPEDGLPRMNSGTVRGDSATNDAANTDDMGAEQPS